MRTFVLLSVQAVILAPVAPPPPRPAPPPASATAPAPAPRWAFVSAYVTVPGDRAARRIKVVSAVFALCDGHELPSALFADADPALRAAVRRATHAPFTITRHALEVHASRDSAEAARRRGMDDERFAMTVEADVARDHDARTTCAVTAHTPDP